MNILKSVAIILIVGFLSCKTNEQSPLLKRKKVEGTWRLLTGTLIEKGDTVITKYDKDISFIKIINETHFAFLQHDKFKGKDSTAVFVAGGGSYELVDSAYTEHLEYCSDRQWEGHDFSFTVEIMNDTLIQQGVEKLENLGIDRINIEKYVRVK